MSFSEQGVGEVKNIHFFESLNNSTGSLLIDNGENGLLFHFSFNSSVNNLQFSIKFLLFDSVFSGGVNKNFTNLIFSSIDIGKVTHINFGVFGQDSKNIGGVNNLNIGFFNESVIEISVGFDNIEAVGIR